MVKRRYEVGEEYPALVDGKVCYFTVIDVNHLGFFIVRWSDGRKEGFWFSDLDCLVDNYYLHK